MAKKVYLSAPLHWYNACAVSGCDENTHNNEYLDELEVYLKASGIETKRGYRRPPKDSSTDGTALMIQNVEESDAWGADVHYVSHTNAFDGTVRGCRPMIYTGSERGEKLAEIMIRHRKEIYNPVTLFPRTDLYELRVPSAVSYYEEHVFHDNAEDAKWFHQNMRRIAQNAAEGLCEYLGEKFVDPYAETNDEPVNNSTVVVELRKLSKGMSGNDVRQAMLILKDRGFYTANIPASDTLFGDKMYAATLSFQKAEKIDIDGVIGKDTWGRLLEK